MTTVDVTLADSSEYPELPVDQSHPEAPNSLRFSMSDVVSIALEAAQKPDFTKSSEWKELDKWIQEAKSDLKKLYASKAKAVSVKGNRIRIVESAVIYDTPYTVEVEGDTYQIIFTSDGMLEIYEVVH